MAKKHYNKSIFHRSPIALAIMLALSNNTLASGVRADIPYQYYRDLAENKGAFTVGARNIKVYDDKKNLVGVMFDKAPMADFSTIYKRYGVATLVDPQFVTSVVHNIGYKSVEFGSNNYHFDNPQFDYLISNRFDDPVYLKQHGSQNDYHNPKLHRLVTESAPVPMLDDIGVSLNDKERFPLILRAGSGLQSRFNITKTAEGEYIYMPKDVLTEFRKRKDAASEKEKEVKAINTRIKAETDEAVKKTLEAEKKVLETEFKELKAHYKEIEDQYKIPVSGPYQFLTGGALQDLHDNQIFKDGKSTFVSGGGAKSVYENSKGQGGPLVSYIQGGDSGSGVQIYDATKNKWFIIGLGDAVVNPGALEPTFTIINTQVRPNQFKENKNSYAHTEINNPTAGQILNFSPSTKDSKGNPTASITGTGINKSVGLFNPELIFKPTEEHKSPGVYYAYKEYDTGRDLDISGQNGTLMLTDNINQGAGGLYFHTDFTVDAQRTGETPKLEIPEFQMAYFESHPDLLKLMEEENELKNRKEKFRWTGSGVVVDEDKRVTWKLAASKAGDRLSKLGKGTLVLAPEIPLTFNPSDLGTISVGDGTVELDLPKFHHSDERLNTSLASRNKPANLQVEIVSGRPTVKVIHGSALNPQKIIFGHRGGTLDLNGNDTTFERVRHIDSGATITSKDKEATLTFKGLKRKEITGGGVLKLLRDEKMSSWHKLGKDGYFYDYTIQDYQHYDETGKLNYETGRLFRYWYYDPSTPYFRENFGYWPEDDAKSWKILGTSDLLPALGERSPDLYWTNQLNDAQRAIFTKMKALTDVRDSLTYYAGYLGNRTGKRSLLAVKYAPELDDRLLLTGGANAKSLTVEKGTVIVQGAPVTHANDYQTNLEVVYDNDYHNPTFDFESIAVKNGAELALSRNLTAVKGDITLEKGAKATLGYSRGDKTYIASRARGGWRENTDTFTEKGFAAMPQTQIRGSLTMNGNDVTFGSKADYEGAMHGNGSVTLNRGSQVSLASGSDFTGKFTAHNEALNLAKSTTKWASDATISPLFIDNHTVTDNPSKLTVQNGANLTINKASSTGDFELAGDLHFDGDKQTLDVQNFVGSNGRVHYRVDTADSTTDVINVAKNASGNTTFEVANSGKEPTAESLTLMNVTGQNDLVATLANNFVDLGAYRYDLNKTDKTFYLGKLNKDEEKKKLEAEDNEVTTTVTPSVTEPVKPETENNEPTITVIPSVTEPVKPETENNEITTAVTPSVTEPVKPETENNETTTAVTPSITEPVKPETETSEPTITVTPSVTEPVKPETENNETTTTVTPSVTKPPKQAEVISRYTNTGISELSGHYNQWEMIHNTIDNRYLKDSDENSVWVSQSYQQHKHNSDDHRPYKQNLHLTQIGVEKDFNQFSIGAVLSQSVALNNFADDINANSYLTSLSLFATKEIVNNVFMIGDISYGYSNTKLKDINIARHNVSLGIGAKGQWELSKYDIKLKVAGGVRYHHLPQKNYVFEDAKIHHKQSQSSVINTHLAVDLSKEFATPYVTIEPKISLQQSNAHKTTKILVNNKEFNLTFDTKTYIGGGLKFTKNNWNIDTNLGVNLGTQIKPAPSANINFSYHW